MSSSQFLNTSSSKASLFDIVAEDSLRATLKPAWEYCCRILQTKYPQNLNTLLQYSDEIFYTLLFLMEEYNLRNKSASITESFYELTRESTSNRGSFMLRHARSLALISVVGLPYITDKLDQRYERIKEDILVGHINVSVIDRILYHTYPILSTLGKWIRIFNYILYLFGFSRFPFPLLYFTKMQLKYIETQDTDHPTHKDDVYKGRFYLLHRLRELFMSLLSKITPLLFYSLQFMDSFYEDDTATKNILTNLTVPDPPQMPEVNVKLPSSKTQCPLCRQQHVKPSTTSISGFVFCYKCLYKYIDQFQCCPITYRPCKITDMVILHH